MVVAPPPVLEEEMEQAWPLLTALQKASTAAWTVSVGMSEHEVDMQQTS